MLFSAQEEKHYNTIRNAISKGATIGMFGANTDKGVRAYAWRLFGDRVEVQDEQGSWMLLADNDMDHPFSIGVIGMATDFSIPAEWLPYVEL